MSDARLLERIAELEFAYQAARERANALATTNNALARELAIAERFRDEVAADNARLRGENERMRVACVSAITAFRGRRDVEEHAMNAAAYQDCADCSNQRPCSVFAQLEYRAQNAAAVAMAELRQVLASYYQPSAATDRAGAGRDHPK